MSLVLLSSPADAFGDEPVAKDVVDGLVRNYKGLHHAHLKTNNTIGFSTVYTAYGMTKLIAALQKMADDGADVCRVYLGAHDDYEPHGDFNYKHKVTLIFVGVKSENGNCPTELLDNDTKLAYDFGTLCPPQCNTCCEDIDSVAKRVYGPNLCAES